MSEEQAYTTSASEHDLADSLIQLDPDEIEASRRAANIGQSFATPVFVVRRKQTRQDFLSSLGARTMVSLAAALMITRMFEMRFRRALGMVLLIKLLTDREPEHLAWTQQSTS